MLHEHLPASLARDKDADADADPKYTCIGVANSGQ